MQQTYRKQKRYLAKFRRHPEEESEWLTEAELIDRDYFLQWGDDCNVPEPEKKKKHVTAPIHEDIDS